MSLRTLGILVHQDSWSRNGVHLLCALNIDATEAFLSTVRGRLAHPFSNICILYRCACNMYLVSFKVLERVQVSQAMLLKPEEKLDSMSCLAYMAPFSSALMLLLCLILEPASLVLLVSMPFEDSALVSALLLNCLAAFASNYFNMVVTKRTSALTIQVCSSAPVAVASMP